MLQIALQMLFQLYYTVLNNTIQFKVVSIYGNIIAKPAGPAGQPSQGVPGVPSGLVPIICYQVMPSANKIKNEKIKKKVEEEL